jgi:4'-phosphopantetheinyl transferase
MSENLLSWSAAPIDIFLQNDEVHIWCADLNLPEISLEQLVNNLSADEQTRAARFIHAQDRSHFIAARAILRDILSRYCKIVPNEIKFNYSAKGKPLLTLEANQPKLFFNLSHSHDLALYAVTNLDRIGVDIEYTRRNIDALEIAERFFSKNEIESLHSLSASEQLIGFYKIWTRKEAYVKAIGEGISHSLDQFSVSISSGKSAVMFDASEPRLNHNWFIYDIPIMGDYEAAIAMLSNDILMQKWCWQAL